MGGNFHHPILFLQDDYNELKLSLVVQFGHYKASFSYNVRFYGVDCSEVSKGGVFHHPYFSHFHP